MIKRAAQSSFLLLLLLFSLPAFSQSIRRSVISSTGAIQSANGTTIRSTVAQPPNAGTVTNTQLFLRQGFQQPLSCGGAPLALLSFASTGTDACEGIYNFSYQGTPEESTSFNWNFGETATPQTSTEQDPQGIRFSSPGIVTVTLEVNTGNCNSTRSVDIDISLTLLSATAIIQDITCANETDGSIDLSITGGTEPYEVNWSNSATGTNLDELAPGIYSYTVTDANTCSFSNDLEVTGVTEALNLVLDPINGDCENPAGQLSATVTGGVSPYSYQWSNGATTASINNIPSGEYSLVLTDANNCEIEGSSEIIAPANCGDGELIFYEAFSPNGDGKNDVWYIEGIEAYTNAHVFIHDRWGQLVYQDFNYSGDWDGTRNDGSQVPFGSYYYVLELNDEKKSVFKGSIAIVR